MCTLVESKNLVSKGTFAYQEGSNFRVAVCKGLYAKIEPVTRDIARVSIVDEGGRQQPLPHNIRMKTEDNEDIASYKGSFLISCSDSYYLLVDGRPVMALNTRVQTVSALASAEAIATQ